MKLSQIKNLSSNQILVALYLIIMCTQFVPIEGYGISWLKVSLMAISPLILIIKMHGFNRAMIWGTILWGTCYLCAYFVGQVRFSTIGYFGLFILAFMSYYTILRNGDINISWFTKLIKILIMCYGIILVAQQLSILAGLRHFTIINLRGEPWQAVTKVPSLAIEPSHAARVLAALMLGYLECLKLMNGGKTPTLAQMWQKENRLMVCLFLWAMLTMGSGTAYIALGLLALYFITWRSAVYVIPLIIAAFAVGNYMQIEQFQRAKNVAIATSTLDNDTIKEEDTSAATRIMPLINLFTNTDLTDKTTWFGEGTSFHAVTSADIMSTKGKLAFIKQYGLISMLISLIFVYTCMIKKFLSIETILFVLLFGLSLGNIAYGWGAMMVFAGVRYFQELAAADELYIEEYIDDEDDVDDEVIKVES